MWPNLRLGFDGLQFQRLARFIARCQRGQLSEFLVQFVAILDANLELDSWKEIDDIWQINSAVSFDWLQLRENEQLMHKTLVEKLS